MTVSVQLFCRLRPGDCVRSGRRIDEAEQIKIGDIRERDEARYTHVRLTRMHSKLMNQPHKTEYKGEWERLRINGASPDSGMETSKSRDAHFKNSFGRGIRKLDVKMFRPPDRCRRGGGAGGSR